MTPSCLKRPVLVLLGTWHLRACLLSQWQLFHSPCLQWLLSSRFALLFLILSFRPFSNLESNCQQDISTLMFYSHYKKVWIHVLSSKWHPFSNSQFVADTIFLQGTYCQSHLVYFLLKHLMYLFLSILTATIPAPGPCAVVTRQPPNGLLTQSFLWTPASWPLLSHPWGMPSPAPEPTMTLSQIYTSPSSHPHIPLHITYLQNTFFSFSQASLFTTPGMCKLCPHPHYTGYLSLSPPKSYLTY